MVLDTLIYTIMALALGGGLVLWTPLVKNNNQVRVLSLIITMVMFILSCKI
jgi:hypothetical protein